uniref:tRNA(Ile)-lysidine synthase, chloroplastic n=1 Tax=Kuetzingia canaliculata TaxID=228262 RepID=A0A1Z1MP18_KUECA|nr:tRNA Ile-lysidine synthetase [Kuetzingia canaliculata]ARW67808.1 tRNA Ile-lysidine synthetase [Kuetzingia canaliculata]
MIYNFTENIKQTIQKYHIKSILLAVSGGKDSISLIQLINKTKKKLLNRRINFTIEYIYVDHQWQKNSKSQVLHLINYIKGLNEKIYIYQIKSIKLSEYKCRIARYHIIIRHAIKYKYKLIITAHNATDKVETLIQNLIRGCGIEGITSLITNSKIHQEIYLIRPLANIKHDTNYWMCKKLSLPVWSDNTNYKYNIQRNRTRNELMPYIKKYFNINIENNIRYLQKNYYYENEYIKQNTIKFYFKIKHRQYISLNLNQLKKQNIALQSRIIQLFCVHAFNVYLNHDKIILIIKLAQKKLNLNYLLNIKLNKIKLYLHLKENKKWLYAKININNN